MNKKERLNVIKKLKPATWYAFCRLEASHDVEVTDSKVKLAAELGISTETLNKYFTIWMDFSLVKEMPGGFIFAQLDGNESGIKTEVKPRRYNKSKDVADYWCEVYFEYFHTPYVISNWGMVLKNIKKLLVYSDEEIEGAIYCAITLYQTKWVSPKYPRPTLGQLCSWLFQQALPYVNKQQPTEEVKIDDNLLDNLMEKGWL